MVLREAGGEAWVVLDDRIHEACLAFQDFRDTVESGAVRRGDTVEEVADRAGVDADGLAATLAATARCAATGRDGRVRPHLLGGAARAAVRDDPGPPRPLPHPGRARSSMPTRASSHSEDRPIPGLYASGGAAAGISGHGASGYLAGNGLLPALGLALLAAEHVAGDGGAA